MVNSIEVKARGWPYNEQDVTVQIFEDGMVMFCNHAGAQEEIITRTSQVYNNVTGEYEERTWQSAGVVCDKCGSYKGVDGDWYE